MRSAGTAGCAMFAAFAILAATSAQAGPFGIDMGDSAAKLQGRSEASSPYDYGLTPPRPAPQIVVYAATIAPKTGACRVLGMTARNEDDPYATKLRGAFDELTESLSAKYGPPTRRIDALKADALWKDPRETTMSLTKGERNIVARWEGAAFPEDVASVTLSAVGRGLDSNFLLLTFEFRNYPACQAEIRAARSNAF